MTKKKWLKIKSGQKSGKKGEKINSGQIKKWQK